MEEKKHIETQKHIETHHIKKKKFSIWKILTAVLFVLLVVSIFTYGFRSGNMQKGVVSKDQAAKKTLDFLNTQLLAGRASATLDSVTEENQMYKVAITLNGQQGSVYVSKDGKYLFPQAIDLDLTLPPISPENIQAESPGVLDNTTQQGTTSTTQQSTSSTPSLESTPPAPPGY